MDEKGELICYRWEEEEEEEEEEEVGVGGDWRVSIMANAWQWQWQKILTVPRWVGTPHPGPATHHPPATTPAQLIGKTDDDPFD